MVSAYNITQQSTQPQTLLPQISTHIHEASPDFGTPFTEYSYRDEGFKIAPYLMESPVAFHEILEVKSDTRGTWQDAEVLSFSCETHTTPAGQKNVARVVVVNEAGECVIDTFIKPQRDDLAVKPGIKSQLFKFSKCRAEPLGVVRDRILRIIKGKHLVGYHLPQKMADFGFFDGEQSVLQEIDTQNESENQPDASVDDDAVPNAISPKKQPVLSVRQRAFDRLQLKECYDMAKIFNGPDQLQQRSITSLCESFLNLSFKKRPAPAFAFTEAKISMALFKQWQLLRDQLTKGATYDEVAEKHICGSASKAALDAENVNPQSVVLPKYPAMPGSSSTSASMAESAAAPTQLRTPKKGSSAKKCKNKENHPTDDEVLTLTGTQLKVLINQYANEALKDELKRVLTTMIH